MLFVISYQLLVLEKIKSEWYPIYTKNIEW